MTCFDTSGGCPWQEGLSCYCHTFCSLHTLYIWCYPLHLLPMDVALDAQSLSSYHIVHCAHYNWAQTSNWYAVIDSWYAKFVPYGLQVPEIKWALLGSTQLFNQMVSTHPTVFAPTNSTLLLKGNFVLYVAFIIYLLAILSWFHGHTISFII